MPSLAGADGEQHERGHQVEGMVEQLSSALLDQHHAAHAARHGPPAQPDPAVVTLRCYPSKRNLRFPSLEMTRLIGVAQILDQPTAVHQIPAPYNVRTAERSTPEPPLPNATVTA